MKTVISRDKVIRMYMIFYTFNTMLISWLAFYSPFVASVFLPTLIITYLVLFATSFYIVGFKQLTTWWNEKVAQAKRRAEMKRAIEEEVTKRMRSSGYV